MDTITLSMAKKYTKDTVAGIGAIKGADGKSAYEIAVSNGFEGTEYEWLESLGKTETATIEEIKQYLTN